MFKVGDRVRYIGNAAYGMYKEEGFITIVAANLNKYDVKFDNFQVVLECNAAELELVEVPTLPHGFRVDRDLEDEGFWMGMPPITLKCDCGGHKTFQSMSPECHSFWCSSRKS